MKVISLGDYAKDKNISYEAVRKQVVRYKDDLGSHIIVDGRQQFLDEDAVAFLDSKRQKNPVAIIQQNKDDQIKELEEQVKQLLIKTAAQAELISEMSQWKADNAMLLAGAEQDRLALQAAQEEKADLQRGYDQAVDELEKMKEEARMRLQQAEEAGVREREAIREAQDLRTRLKASEEAQRALEDKKREFESLPWWKKPFWK